MFNNWINFYELYNLFRKFQRDPKTVSSRLRAMFFRSGIDRTKGAWAFTSSPPVHWWDIPAIQERWNCMISGNAKVDYRDYVCSNYWSERFSMRALSLGCGTGAKEMSWAETNKFSRIDAYDLSETRISAANEAAKKRGLDHVLNFEVGNVYKLSLQENSYDVVFGEGSLHHFSPLDSLMEKIERTLKPDGFFVVNDFVGPTRFQWTERQLEIINSLLAILPDKYKALWNSEYIKNQVIRPSRLGMVLKDPSEAVESSRIVPLMEKYFDVDEIKGYGGAILHPLLDGISHHFLAADKETQAFLELCFTVEDLSLTTQAIQHDHVVAVCRKKQ